MADRSTGSEVVVSVRAPATSANLGPGFDALGLALSWYDDVSGRLVAETAGSTGTAETTVAVRGQGAGELPSDDRHLVVRAIHATFAQLGMAPLPVALTCENRIPQARGLGSSSAAIVAGVLIGRELAGVAGAAVAALDQAALLRIAAGLEGHPDNVAPCLLGGFTIAWQAASDGDSARAVTTMPAAEVQPVVFVPEQRGLTEAARAALPDQVPHRDAAHAAGRAALLVHAITREPATSLLLAATDDRLHQPYRATAAPQTAALVARLRAAGVPAVVSGAGPSVLAFGPVPARLRQQSGWVCHEVAVDRYGATVRLDMMPAYTG